MRALRVGSSILLLLAAIGPPASAQDRTEPTTRAPVIFGGVAWASHWDDETFLGRGPLLAGGVSLRVVARLAVEAEIAWATHHRDAGYLIADGTPLLATGRLAYRFRGPAARTRPFISGGLTVVHTTGHFTTRSFVPGPDGRPVPGPDTRQDWSATQAGWEVGAGLEIAGSYRLMWRPEVRWTATTADPSFTPGSLEPPLWTIRAGMTIGWAIAEPRR
jgi:opacity protein-like surface antigen